MAVKKKTAKETKEKKRARRVGDKKIVTTSITIPREIWQELKMMSIEKGISLSEVIVELVKESRKK